jgi:hypothetical protein
MRTLTDREKRTIRLGAIALVAYLILFAGLRTWKALETKRSNYQQLVTEAQRLRRELQPYENRVLLAQKLRETFHIEPRNLSRASVVADASAAIQKAATGGGMQLGPIRESPARSSAKELASMQLEGTGPVPAAMSLLQRLEVLGFPLVIDTVQITPDPAKPGMVKLNLTIVILDYTQWNAEEKPHA